MRSNRSPNSDSDQRASESWNSRRALAVVGLSLATIVALLLVVVTSQLLALPVATFAGNTAAVVAGGALAVVLVLLAVWLLHRRRPNWTQIGLTLNRRAPVQVGVGIGIAGLIAVVCALVVSITGTANWHSSAQSKAWLLALPINLATALLLQSFPEELMFRGHLQERLTKWLGPIAIVTASTLAFGIIHMISGGPQNATEQLYVVLQATAFGFSCAAARYWSGTIWIAVGLHGGFHIWRGLLVPSETVVSFTGAITAIAGYLLVGMLFLARARRQPDRRTQVENPV